MKNLSLILNLVLFILVGILFYLQFSDKNSHNESGKLSNSTQTTNLDNENVPSMADISKAQGKIVFIDYDSLVQGYEFFRKMEKELESKLKKSENELMSKQKKLEEDYQSYMQGQSMMTEQHRATKEQQLTKQNQDLIQLRDERARQFSSQEQELNEKLMENMYGYFNKLGKENKFDYILTYKRGLPGVVFGSDSLNITKEVLQGLNNEYKNQNK